MRIPVIGAGVVSGMGIGVEANLQAIRAGSSGLSELTLFDSCHRVPVGELKKTNKELAELLGLSSRRTYSRTALLGMLAASEAIRDAQISCDSQRIGLISATSVGGMDQTEQFYPDFLVNPDKGKLRMVRTHDCGDSTDEIASYCGIDGFRTTISTACSSAANAIMLGARMLQKGMLDLVVVGGTDALCKFTLNGFNSLMILDKEPCRPFDKSRSGLNLGEGAAYLVLAREDYASDKKPYAVLSGYANANDAFHQTATSAEGEGAYRSMSAALKKSGLQPEEIDYVNVHGTGTQNNDSSEGAALLRVFGDHVPAFSSTKAFTGHTLAAAGGIEAVFSVMAVNRGILYPNLNFQSSQDERLCPLTVYSESECVKQVMSNSFGFGGNSSTLIFSAIL